MIEFTLMTAMLVCSQDDLVGEEQDVPAALKIRVPEVTFQDNDVDTVFAVLRAFTGVEARVAPELQDSLVYRDKLITVDTLANVALPVLFDLVAHDWGTDVAWRWEEGGVLFHCRTLPPKTPRPEAADEGVMRALAGSSQVGVLRRLNAKLERLHEAPGSALELLPELGLAGLAAKIEPATDFLDERVRTGAWSTDGGELGGRFRCQRLTGGVYCNVTGETTERSDGSRCSFEMSFDRRAGMIEVYSLIFRVDDPSIPTNPVSRASLDGALGDAADRVTGWSLRGLAAGHPARLEILRYKVFETPVAGEVQLRITKERVASPESAFDAANLAPWIDRLASLLPTG